jgi:hypothetical protein
MTKRLLDHLLAEDVLQLRDGLRRAEDVEARVEAPHAEAAPAPAESADADTQPTIAATRRANHASRSRGGLVAVAVVLVVLAAGGAYVALDGKDDAAHVPPPQALPKAPAIVTAPTQVTAASAATTATDEVTAAAAAGPAEEPPAAEAAPAAAAGPAEEPQQASEPPAPAAPAEEFWVVAGPFQSEDAAAGIKTYAPDLTIRQDIRNVKLSAQVVRSEAPTSEADARNLADQLAAYGLAAVLEPDGEGFRLSVGPLASPSAAEQAATLLLSLGHPARASRVQVDSAVVYVDVGPLPTEEEASALSRTIQERLSVRTGLKREATAP